MIRSLALLLFASVACSDDTAEKPALTTQRKPSYDPNALVGPAVPGRREVKREEAEIAPDPTASLGADLPGRASPLMAAARWKITPRGVGTLSLGSKLHEPARGFEGSYVTSFYADAQPLEGFALDEPPVLAVVEGGPFPKWGRTHPGGTPSESLKAQAMQLARAGKLTVRMIVTTDPRPKTEVGIGVGDDYLTFEKRYPEAPEPQVMPALWEEPTCVTTVGTLSFFFDRCDTRAQAKIIRIVVRAPDPAPAKPQKPRRKVEADTEY